MPVVEAPTEAVGTAFQPFGGDRPRTDDESAVERPVIVHSEPPTAEDFRVVPVEGDWVTHRGNFTRSGLREARAITTPRVRWSIEVGVQGYSNTPIVTADAIYVTSQGTRHDREDEGDGVMALDPATGAVRWRTPVAGDVNGATLVGDVLVVGGDGRALVGLDRATGRVRWRLEQECQVYHAPLLLDGWLYWIRSDEVGWVRVHPETGIADGPLDCYRPERGSVSGDADGIFRAGDQSLRAYDSDGMVWESAPIGEDAWSRSRWSPSLLLSSMVIDTVSRHPFGVGSLRTVHRPAAVARWRDNGQIAWVADVGDPAFANREPGVTDTPFLRSMPWVLGERMYWTPITEPAIVVWDVVSGERVGAIPLPDCRNRAFSSIVGTPEMGYYARHDGVLYGFDPAELRVVWTLSLGLHAVAGSRASHHPVSGPCQADPKDGSALFSTPAIGEDGTLYVGSGDGWLYAISDASW